MDSSITAVMILMDEIMNELRVGWCTWVGRNPERTPRDGSYTLNQEGQRTAYKIKFDDEDRVEVYSYKAKELVFSEW